MGGENKGVKQEFKNSDMLKFIYKKILLEVKIKRKNFLFHLLLVLVLLSFSAVTAIGQAVMCGDVNDDGTTDIVDALLIAQCYVGITTCPAAAVGDVNCDEQIDIVDALLIAQFYVDITTLSCCITSETPSPTPAASSILILSTPLLMRANTYTMQD